MTEKDLPLLPVLEYEKGPTLREQLLADELKIPQDERPEVQAVAELAPPMSGAKPLSPTRKSRKLTLKAIAGEAGMARLLHAMKHASGLSQRVIAERMGLKDRSSLNRYFWDLRGRNGGSRLSWFLRYAEATGCRVWVTFPSKHEQQELVELFQGGRELRGNGHTKNLVQNDDTRAK